VSRNNLYGTGDTVEDDFPHLLEQEKWLLEVGGLVAQHVIGIDDVEDRYIIAEATGVHCTLKGIGQVVRAMEKREERWCMCLEVDDETLRWRVFFYRPNSLSTHGRNTQATAPLAVAVAALKTLGVEVPPQPDAKLDFCQHTE